MPRAKLGFFAALAACGWLTLWAVCWLAYHHTFFAALMVATYYGIPLLIIGALLDAAAAAFGRRRNKDL